MKSAKLPPHVDTVQPLAGSEVITDHPPITGDPYEQFDELMKVIEELCPEWPKRETFKERRLSFMSIPTVKSRFPREVTNRPTLSPKDEQSKEITG